MTIVHVKQLHTSRYQLAYLHAVEMEHLVQLLIANLLPIGPEEGVLKAVFIRLSKRQMLG